MCRVVLFRCFRHTAVPSIPVEDDHVAGPVWPPPASGFQAIGPAVPDAAVNGHIYGIIIAGLAGVSLKFCPYRLEDTGFHLFLKDPVLPPSHPENKGKKADHLQDKDRKYPGHCH